MSCSTGALHAKRETFTNTANLVVTNNTWSGATSDDNNCLSEYGISSVTENFVVDTTTGGASSGSYTGGTPSVLIADKTYKYRAHVFSAGTGTVKTSKTGALLATASTPTASSIAATSVHIDCNYSPKVNESTCTATLYYKKNTDAWPGTAFGTPGTTGGYGTVSLSENLTGLDPLTTYNIRLTLVRNTAVVADNTVYSSILTFDTLANTPVLTTSAASDITYVTATLNGTVDPNNFSTAVTFVYGTTLGGPYPNETSAVSGSPFSDDTVHNVNASIGFLASATPYYYKAKGVYSGTAYYGSEQTFTTSDPPATPDVTTYPADNISSASARLNAVVGPNTHNTTYYFQYVTDTQYQIDAWTSASTTAVNGPSTQNYPFYWDATVSGLTSSTLYHFRGVAVFAPTTYYGSGVTFTTIATPGDKAIEEDHVIYFEFDRVYGAGATLYFLLVTPSATDSDTFLNAAAPFAAAECLISKDGSAFTQTTNPIARANADQLYKIILTTTETEAEDIWILAHDNAVGARDVALHVRTKIQTGQLTVNADNIATNTDAIALTSNGTGKAIDCVAGDIYTAGKIQTVGNLAVGGDVTAANVTLTTNMSIGGNLAVTGNITAAALTAVITDMVLDSGTIAGYNAATPSVTLGASASTTADTYNGGVVVILSGAGIGQCRTIVDYAATTKIATVDSAFATSPNACTYVVVPGQLPFGQKPLVELSALPAVATATWGDLIQFLFQRFAYKRYQDATSQKLYKADSSTVIATGTFQDNTTDQTIGKLV